MDKLWVPDFPWYLFLIRGAIVYLAILAMLRISGKREIGQMGAAEFVSILLVSNAVQNSMNGNDGSVTGGLILAFVVVSLTFLAGYFSFRSRRASLLLEGAPTLLVHRGEVLTENLKRELMNRDDLRTMLRKNGVADIGHVFEAVLEGDGHLSVLCFKDVGMDRPPHVPSELTALTAVHDPA